MKLSLFFSEQQDQKNTIKINLQPFNEFIILTKKNVSFRFSLVVMGSGIKSRIWKISVKFVNMWQGCSQKIIAS
jgi:hypothetical protein